jgi:adenylate kinase
MIIFISGSINAGKTTTSKLLAERLGWEFFELDEIGDAMPEFELKTDIPKVFDEGIRRLNELDGAGKNVVVTYVLRHEDYERLERELNAETKYVTLAPSLKVAKTDRGQRRLKDWELESIDYHYLTGIADPSFGTIIDNSNITPEETVERIIQML